MENRNLKIAMSSAVFAFYVAILMYVFFAVLHIDSLENFASAMIFEVIGFVLLYYFIITGIISKQKIGYYVPLILVTVLYTVILDIVNLAFAAVISHTFFLLIHLILLFVYCLISVPMYIMGRR